MFEGWAADLLASYLGHFVDVKKEALRIGLWSGLVLKDVRLRSEAFEYLQLPLKLHHGSIGRLQVRLPWGAFTLPNSYITIQLDDVMAVASPRGDNEFFGGSKGQEAAAALQEELAHELEELQNGTDRTTANRHGRSLLASLAEYLASLLLRRLKLNVTGVCLRFVERWDKGGDLADLGTRCELRFTSLFTREQSVTRLQQGGASLRPASQTALLGKDLELQGLSFAWWPGNNPEDRQQRQGVEECSMPPPLSHWSTSNNYVLHPMDTMIRASMGRSGAGGASKFSLAAQVNSFQLQVRESSVIGILQIVDQAEQWTRKNRYARFRPAVLPAAGCGASWKPVWLFAIEAVRFNLGMKERAPAAMRLRRQKCRAQYISLFKHRLQRGLADDEGVDGDDEAANEDELLQALEAKLTLAQVLLYRTLAKRAVAEEASQQQPATPVQTWLGWGASYFTGYFSYLPQIEGHSSIPTDAAIKELSNMLEQEEVLNPGRPAASVEVNVAVIHGKVLVQSSTAGSGPGVRPRLQIGASKLFAPWPQQTSTAWKSTRFRFFSLPMRLPMPPQDIVSVEAYKLTASVALDVEGNSRLDASLADISVHDLCSDPGVSEVLLVQGDSNSFPNLASNRNTSGSLPPVLKIAFELLVPAGRRSTDAQNKQASSSHSPCVQLFVAPVAVVARPICLGRIMQFVSKTSEVYNHRVAMTSAAGRIETRLGRTVAKSEYLSQFECGPALDIHVERAAILMPKSAKSMSHGVLISVTGLMMQIHEGLSTQEASDVIQALKSQGPRTRSHMSTSFAQMKLEDNLLVDRVSLACSGADVHVFKNGRSGLQLLGSSGFSMSMAISKLPPPTVSDIPLVRVVLSLPPLKLRIPMCQLKLLLSVGEALQVMQSMFPPPPAADETLPQDARIGHVLFAVNLESMEAHIEDKVAGGSTGRKPNAVVLRCTTLTVQTAGPPHETVVVGVRQVEVVDDRFFIRGKRLAAFPSWAAYLSVGTIDVNVDNRDAGRSSTHVAVSGIMLSGYPGQACNFIQMCHHNPNLPSVEVIVQAQTVAARRKTSTSVTICDACIGLELVTGIVDTIFHPPSLDDSDDEGEGGGDCNACPEAANVPGQQATKEELSFSLELRKCQVALGALETIAAHQAENAGSSPQEGPSYLLLSIPQLNLNLPVSTDRQENRDVLYMERVSLCACFGSLQPTQPAFLDIPYAHLVEKGQNTSLQAPPGDGTGSPTSHVLDLDVGCIDACISLQLLDKLSAVISSVHDFIEAVTPPEDPGHDEADDGDNATTREPDASVPADDTIQARLSFLSVSVSMECLAARLVDGGGSDVAFASLQGLNLAAEFRQVSHAQSHISAVASLHGLDVLSMLSDPWPRHVRSGHASSRAIGLEAFGSQHSIATASSSVPSLQLDASTAELAEDPLWATSDALPTSPSKPSQERIRIGPQSSSSHVSSPVSDHVEGISEEDDEFQDAPEDFSPSGSFGSSKGTFFLQGWGRQRSSRPGRDWLRPNRAKSLKQTYRTLLSVGSTRDADTSEQQQQYMPGSRGIELQLQIDNTQHHGISPGAEVSASEDFSSGSVGHKVAITITPWHAAVSAAGWETALETLTRCAQKFESLDIQHRTGGSGRQEPGNGSSVMSAEFTATVAGSTVAAMTRPFLRNQPCSISRFSGWTPMPMLWFTAKLSADGTFSVGPSIEASASIRIEDVSATPACLAPKNWQHAAAAGPFQSQADIGEDGSGNCKEDMPTSAPHVDILNEVLRFDAGPIATISSAQAQLDVRDDVRSTVAITKAQASASNHRIQLLSAWLSDLPVASSGGDQGSMKPGGRTSSRTGDPGGLLQSTVSIVTRKPCLAVSLVAKMDILSCLFSDDCMNVDGVPLLDLSLRDTEIELHGTVGGSDDSMSGILSTTLAGDVYSAEKKGWDCLVEPWKACLHVEVLQPWTNFGAAYGTPGVAARGVPMRMPVLAASMTSESILQLTFSVTASDVLSLVLASLDESTIMSPGTSSLTLKKLLAETAGDEAPAGSYQLINATGCNVFCWPAAASPAAAMSVVALAKLHLSGGSSFSFTRHMVEHGSSVLLSKPQPPLAGVAFPRNRSNTADRHTQQKIRYRLQLENQIAPCTPLAMDEVGVHRLPAVLYVNNKRVSLSIVAEVDRVRHGGRSVLLHGSLQLTNKTGVALEVATRDHEASSTRSLGVCFVDSSIWFPVSRAEMDDICFRPHQTLQGDGPAWEWGEGICMPDLIAAFRREASPSKLQRRVLCKQAGGGSPPFLCFAGLQPLVLNKKRAGWTLKVEPALVVHNNLPVSLGIELLASEDAPSQAVGVLGNIPPLAQVAYTDLEPDNAARFRVMLPKHCPSSVWSLPACSPPELDDEELPQSKAKSHEVLWGNGLCRVELEMHGSANTNFSSSGASMPFRAALVVRAGVSLATGAWQLQVSSDLWVYNCTGIPLMVRALSRRESESEADSCSAWVAPFRVATHSSQQHEEGKHDILSLDQAIYDSNPGMAGALVPMERQTRADVLKAISLNNEPDPTSQGPWSAASPYAAAAAANHAVPWPGMASSSSCSSGPRQEQEHIQNPPALQVQLSCALDAKPDEGWSNSMVLGGLNATATAEVALSCNPSHGIVQASPSLLQVAVASLPIAGAAGTLALHLLPKFVLHNSLSVPLLWRQAGQSPGRPHTLPAGATVAVAWDRCPPAGQAWTPCVAVRVQEASWDWSSSFRIDSPGDVFVKLRHRVQDDAMLVGVDVDAAPGGCWIASLSMDTAGFAPYRIDNCTSYTLHCRQESCNVRADVLRPYCSLPYAWDEPGAAHRIVVELQGGQLLGAFPLDEVGFSAIRSLGHGYPEAGGKDTLLVAIRAEGPTCVLQVTDTKLHIPTQDQQLSSWRHHVVKDGRQPASTPGASQGTVEGSGSLAARAAAGTHWEIALNLAGVGLSLVGAASDLLYACVEGIEVCASSGRASYTFGLQIGAVQAQIASSAGTLPESLPACTSTKIALGFCLGTRAYVSTLSAYVKLFMADAKRLREHAGIQVDNQLPNAMYPVLMCSPVRRLRMGGLRRARPMSRALQEAVMAPRAHAPPSQQLPSSVHALEVNLAVWRRRPGGVICIESLNLQAGSMAVQLDEAHLASLVTFVLDAIAPHRERLIRQLPAEAPLGSSAAHLPDPRLLALLNHNTLQAVPLMNSPLAEQMIYVEHMTVQPIEVTLSFASAASANAVPDLNAMPRWTWLSELEEAQLRLQRLEMHNPLLRANALVALISQHYSREIFPTVLRLVGSIGIMGDPLRNLQYLGLGVLQFVAGPASGFVQSVRGHGPRRFAQGVAEGTDALFRNVIFAASNATSKFSSAARKGLTNLGIASTSLERDPGNLPEAASASLLSGVMRGIAGIVSEPIRGLDQSGLTGFAKGLVSGAAGVVGQPAAEVLQISERLATSVRHLVSGSPGQLPRMRLPRPVSPTEPLHVYSWLDAVGNTLLPAMEVMQACESEVVISCVELLPLADTQGERPGRTATTRISSPGGEDTAPSAPNPSKDEPGATLAGRPSKHFAIITQHRAAAICVPADNIRAQAAEVLWMVNLKDVLLVTREERTLQFLSLASFTPAASEAPQTAGTPASQASAPQAGASSPLSQVALSCTGEGDAVELEKELGKILGANAAEQQFLSSSGIVRLSTAHG